jgi:hypothetical protein
MKIKILGTCTFSISILTLSKIRRSLLKKKNSSELAGQITYPICNIYYQIKGQNSSKIGQNGMKFYHSLEILTNKLQNKFQLDIWKEYEIIRKKPRTDGIMDRHHRT